MKVEEKPVKVVQKPEEDDSYNVEKDPRCVFWLFFLIRSLFIHHVKDSHCNLGSDLFGYCILFTICLVGFL